MAISATSNAVFGITDIDTFRTKTHSVKINFSSLKPNTTYAVTLDNISYGWACKPFGGVLGGPLVSDAKGKLNFNILIETPVEGQISGDMNTGTSDTSINTQLNQQNSNTSTNYLSSSRLLVVSAPNSFASKIIPRRTLVIPGDSSSAVFHGH